MIKLDNICIEGFCTHWISFYLISQFTGCFNLVIAIRVESRCFYLHIQPAYEPFIWGVGRTLNMMVFVSPSASVLGDG